MPGRFSFFHKPGGLAGDHSNFIIGGSHWERGDPHVWRSDHLAEAWSKAAFNVVSFGAGIIFVEPLNKIEIGGFPLGFWFSQQGSIITFVALIAYYVWRMDKLDDEYGVDELDSASANTTGHPGPAGGGH